MRCAVQALFRLVIWRIHKEEITCGGTRRPRHCRRPASHPTLRKSLIQPGANTNAPMQWREARHACISCSSSQYCSELDKTRFSASPSNVQKLWSRQRKNVSKLWFGKWQAFKSRRQNLSEELCYWITSPAFFAKSFWTPKFLWWGSLYPRWVC